MAQNQLLIIHTQLLIIGVIDRPDLQEILLDECKKIKPDFIQNGNPVEGYVSKGRGNGVTVNLADGSTAEADILVGSDGIWFGE